MCNVRLPDFRFCEMLLELAVFAGLPWCDSLKCKPTVHVVPVAF